MHATIAKDSEQAPLYSAGGGDMTPPQEHGSHYYLDRQARTESNARTYPRRLPLAIRRAQGLYVTDMDGKVTWTACVERAHSPWDIIILS
jgi:hypothetical protein